MFQRSKFRSTGVKTLIVWYCTRFSGIEVINIANSPGPAESLAGPRPTSERPCSQCPGQMMMVWSPKVTHLTTQNTSKHNFLGDHSGRRTSWKTTGFLWEIDINGWIFPVSWVLSVQASVWMPLAALGMGLCCCMLLGTVKMLPMMWPWPVKSDKCPVIKHG